MGGMGDIAMILVVGGIAVYGLYAYNQGAFGTPGTTTTTGITTDTGMSTPDTTYPEDSAGNELSDVAIQCQNQGGRWQGTCCSCPNALCYNPCRGVQATNAETCSYEGGRWLPDVKKCYCPNLRCSNKFGGNENPSGGVKGGISQFEKDSKLCQSEGGGWFGTKNCCSCPNQLCKNKCPPVTRTPLRQSQSKKTPDAREPANEEDRGTDESRPKSSGGGVGGPSDSKKYVAPKPKIPATPAPVCKSGTKYDWRTKKCVGVASSTTCTNGKSFAKCPKCKSLCNSPTSFTACCKTASNYASAYLAGSSNRRGPSYGYRDDFRHYTGVEFPTPVDFEYEAKYHPNWLGTQSPERSDLLKRFNAYRAMRFSG